MSLPMPDNPRFLDRIGERHGKLRVVAYAGKDPKGKHTWKCECKCGNFATVRANNLVSKNTKSCGACNGKPYAAFGERKNLKAWLADSRCVVSVKTVKKRLAEGMTFEAAISTPAHRELRAAA